MEILNFPEFRFDFKKQEDKILIYDIIRKKHVILTPEEWVRQHLVHFLIFKKFFPKSLMKVESGLNYHKKQKRADLIIYNDSGVPFIIAECKSPKSIINQNALFQIGVYQKSISPKYLIVTNGITHFMWRKNNDLSRYDQIPEIPEWDYIS
ncbi:MAG TPA: type I restriction enzyme HsdR N-terminal domain-containing protein [Cyclobacteriaceae bacterium]|jgi:hypothetical protein